MTMIKNLKERRQLVGFRDSTYRYLEQRAKKCNRTIDTVVSEIVECWIAQERGRERLKTESPTEGGEDVVIEKTDINEEADDYSIATERRTEYTTE